MGRFSSMKTWTATTIIEAGPEAVLDVLTDPDAVARWAPLPFDVAYDWAASGGGSEVRASISVRSGKGFTGRLIAEATNALLSAGALTDAISRLGREAACPA